MSVVLIIIVLVAVVLGPDFYIWWNFVRGVATLFWSVLFWVPTGVLFLSLVMFLTGLVSGEWGMRIFFGMVLCVVVPKLLFTLISLVGLGVGVFAPKAFAIANICGVVVSGVCLCAFLYGFIWGWKRLEVREMTFASAEVPRGFDGYRIMQISDLHLGTFGKDTVLVKRLVERVNALEPDLIVFTGDLVNVSASEISPFVEILSGLHAPDGVFSVLGNHDCCTYSNHLAPDGANAELEKVKKTEAALGWKLLLNEHVILRRGGDSLVLLGVENVGRPPFPSMGDLPATMQGVPEGAFKILLTHDPTHWRHEVLPSTDIQLTLSGHTHAMQLRIGRFSPSSWAFGEWGGEYREGERVLNVSLGVGGTVPLKGMLTESRSQSVRIFLQMIDNQMGFFNFRTL